MCDDPWSYVDQLCVSARAFSAATCCARQCVHSSRPLNILSAREPMGLSLHIRLHRMTLTSERKNSRQISREIEFFSNFVESVPMLVPKHNLIFFFEFSAAKSVDCYDWFKNLIRLVKRKLHFPCGMSVLFLRLASNRNRSKLEDVEFRRLITKLCTELNFSVLKQNKSTGRGLGEEISGNGFLTIGKWKFTILQNGMASYTYQDSILSPECLAFWSRWTVCDWKCCSRPWFYSLQFAAQAEKWRWTRNCKYLIFQNLTF